jgi:hypothetical protein
MPQPARFSNRLSGIAHRKTAPPPSFPCHTARRRIGKKRVSLPTGLQFDNSLPLPFAQQLLRLNSLQTLAFCVSLSTAVGGGKSGVVLFCLPY